jgi:acetyl-CoA carboxylase carboxyl transferase subunit alpha
MGVTAERLTELELVDGVLEEPLGGAHRDPDAMAATISAALVKHLADLGELTVEERLAKRYERLMAFGRFEEG